MMRRSRLESVRRRINDVLFRNTRNAALPENIQQLLTGDGCAREFVLRWARGGRPAVMVSATEHLRGSCPGTRAAWGHLADNCRVTACLVHSVLFFFPRLFFFFVSFLFWERSRFSSLQLLLCSRETCAAFKNDREIQLHTSVPLSFDRLLQPVVSRLGSKTVVCWLSTKGISI